VPQLLRSTLRFEHAPLHDVVGDGQPHWPFAHELPPLHVTPQDPQLLVSLVRLTHAPAQSVSDAAHVVVQLPRLHTWLDEHGVAQPPQWAGSL
jgi:hypothetical protein